MQETQQVRYLDRVQISYQPNKFRRLINMKSVTSQLSDEAIHQIFEIIASEIDDIDDKELSIYLED